MDLEQLNYLTLYENENSILDFKGAQYRKKQFSDFIKDVCAFANGRSTEEKFIIIGVIHHADGTREFRSVGNEDIFDQSIFQKLILEHISPDIHFEMIPFEHGEYHLVCFRIYECNDRPYLIKKEYSSIKGDKSKVLCLGQGWIRKGDTNFPLTRNDLDEIYTQKIKEHYEFSDKVNLVFAESNSSEIVVTPINHMDLPSDQARSKILEILEKRKKEEFEKKNKITELDNPYILSLPACMNSLMQNSTFQMRGIHQALGYGVPYNERSTEELEEILPQISDLYLENDIFKIYKDYSYILQFIIENNGPTFLKNVTFIIRIENCDGFYMFTDEPEEPNEGILPVIKPRFDGYKLFDPIITKSNSFYTIKYKIKEIPHNIPEKVFNKPPHFFVQNKIKCETIPIQWELHAENNPEPLTGNLNIHISKGNFDEGQNDESDNIACLECG